MTTWRTLDGAAYNQPTTYMLVGTPYRVEKGARRWVVRNGQRVITTRATLRLAKQIAEKLETYRVNGDLRAYWTGNTDD